MDITGPPSVKDAETRRRLAVYERATWGPKDQRVATDQADRSAVNYVESSPYGDRNCGNCLHYLSEGRDFGICRRVKGLIEAGGYSDNYEPLPGTAPHSVVTAHGKEHGFKPGQEPGQTE